MKIIIWYKGSEDKPKALNMYELVNKNMTEQEYVAFKCVKTLNNEYTQYTDGSMCQLVKVSESAVRGFKTNLSFVSTKIDDELKKLINYTSFSFGGSDIYGIVYYS